jgi:methionyl-tRNA formyltransferase
MPGLITGASPHKGIMVSCGKGKLSILELQPPGKKNMDGPSFVRGYRIQEGQYIHNIT